MNLNPLNLEDKFITLFLIADSFFLNWYSELKKFKNSTLQVLA